MNQPKQMIKLWVFNSTMSSLQFKVKIAKKKHLIDMIPLNLYILVYFTDISLIVGEPGRQTSIAVQYLGLQSILYTLSIGIVFNFIISTAYTIIQPLQFITVKIKFEILNPNQTNRTQQIKIHRFHFWQPENTKKYIYKENFVFTNSAFNKSYKSYSHK